MEQTTHILSSQINETVAHLGAQVELDQTFRAELLSKVENFLQSNRGHLAAAVAQLPFSEYSQYMLAVSVKPPDENQRATKEAVALHFPLSVYPDMDETTPPDVKQKIQEFFRYVSNDPYRIGYFLNAFNRLIGKFDPATQEEIVNNLAQQSEELTDAAFAQLLHAPELVKQLVVNNAHGANLLDAVGNRLQNIKSKALSEDARTNQVVLISSFLDMLIQGRYGQLSPSNVIKYLTVLVNQKMTIPAAYLQGIKEYTNIDWTGLTDTEMKEAQNSIQALVDLVPVKDESYDE